MFLNQLESKNETIYDSIKERSTPLIEKARQLEKDFKNQFIKGQVKSDRIMNYNDSNKFEKHPPLDESIISSLIDPTNVKKIFLVEDFKEQENTWPIVYCDGACSNNGSENAEAGIGVYWSKDSQWNISKRISGYQTNNRAELLAAYNAVMSAIKQNFKRVEIRTDSQYTINCIVSWIDNWKKNDWKIGHKNVANRTDIERLYDACMLITTRWKFVKGHSGDEGNEAANNLAMNSIKTCDKKLVTTMLP